jgi:energy-coupling factor transporter ATP-binding protein EcfA2
VRYGSVGAEALRGVSLRVGEGERVALLGLNGSGKTTLLCAAAGLVPFVGRIEVGGVALSSATVRAVRDRLGFLFGVPDDQILFPNVLDDVAFSLERRGVPRETARARAMTALSALGVGALAPQSPHALSQGQRQRVALAGALVAQPPVLLLDEPSASLDPLGQEALAELLAAQNAALLIATHDLAFARRVCAAGSSCWMRAA